VVPEPSRRLVTAPASQAIFRPKSPSCFNDLVHSVGQITSVYHSQIELRLRAADLCRTPCRGAAYPGSRVITPFSLKAFRSPAETRREPPPTRWATTTHQFDIANHRTPSPRSAPSRLRLLSADRPRGSTGGGDHAVPDGPRRATKSVTRSAGGVVSQFVFSTITTSGGRKILGICLHQAVVMTRPYRDVLVWLVGIQPPDNNSFAERAIACVAALLATYEIGHVGRGGSLNDQGRVPSPVIKRPMARNNVTVMDYQVHEIDRVHQFFRGPVRTRLAHPDLIAPVLRLKIHIPHDLPHLM
jgi:hypothetical protein